MNDQRHEDLEILKQLREELNNRNRLTKKIEKIQKEIDHSKSSINDVSDVYTEAPDHTERVNKYIRKETKERISKRISVVETISVLIILALTAWSVFVIYQNAGNIKSLPFFSNMDDHIGMVLGAIYVVDVVLGLLLAWASSAACDSRNF